MNLSKKTREKLERLGVKFPLTGSAEELQFLLKAFVVEKEIDVQVIKSYFKSTVPATKELIQGLVLLSKEQNEISHQALEIINNAIEVCKIQLEKDLDRDERRELNDQILKYVQEARKESQAQREFNLDLAKIGGAVLIITAGVAVYFFTRGKNPEVILKGIDIANKSVNRT